MKKLALILSMLLCLVPTLASCGANSSPEDVATAYIEAVYEDFDYEALGEICYNLNLELYEDVFEGSDKLEGMKESIRATQGLVKESFKETQKELDKLEDYELDYEVRYCEIYDEKDDEFDEIIEKNSDINDTDLEDLIDEVAKVRIVGEIYITDEDGDDDISEIDKTFTCYCIDGDWFVKFS